MITITKGQALEALTEAVKEKGADYIYNRPRGVDGRYGGCLYTDKDSRPSCIVGHALVHLGVPTDVLHAIDWGGAVVLDDFDYDTETYLDEPAEVTLPEGEGLGDTSIDESSVLTWLRRNEVFIDEGAQAFFAIAQNLQDNGKAWGEAVSLAVANTGSVVK